MKIKDLPIGSIVYDELSIWDFRSGDNYAEGTTFKKEPVRWIVYKHGHFSDNSTLLLSEELVASKRFNSSTKNTPWRTMEIRRWLRDVFWNHFTDRFKKYVVECTTTTRGETITRSEINTDETVFLLSVPELGDTDIAIKGNHGKTIYTFTTDKDRIARLNGYAMEYWTRSPYLDVDSYVAFITRSGSTYCTNYNTNHAHNSKGIRPALNIDSDVRVIQKEENVFILDIYPGHLIKSNNKYYTYQDNEFIEVEPVVENFMGKSIYLSDLTTPTDRVVIPMEDGKVLEDGKIYRKTIDISKYKSIERIIQYID